VVLKLEFRSGGRGNEVLSPIEGVRPVGARRTVVLSGRPAVHAYLEESWEWLTSGGRHQVVVERYFRDSAAYFVEFILGDEGIELGGHGEMQSAPYYMAQIIPADLDPGTLERLIEGGRRMCVPLHAMGYRGMLSADAIVTPDRQVLSTPNGTGASPAPRTRTSSSATRWSARTMRATASCSNTSGHRVGPPRRSRAPWTS
jgi:hypothetical protein